MPAEADAPLSKSRPRESLAVARFARSVPGLIGLAFLTFMMLCCLLTLPWTMGRTTIKDAASNGSFTTRAGPPRYAEQSRFARQLPPTWWPIASDSDESWLPADRSLAERTRAAARQRALERLADQRGVTADFLEAQRVEPSADQIKASRAFYLMGTDLLGRDVFKRVLAGGGISLAIGLAAAMLSVFLGTVYGAIAGYFGGRVDAVMMRVVDILYGLPYVLLVVLLAVAGDALMDEYVTRARARSAFVAGRASERMGVVPRPGRAQAAAWLDTHPSERRALEADALVALPPRIVSERTRTAYDLLVLLVAIGGVSWLTMARVIRGQVLSLKSQAFMEAARALGVPVHRQFLRHLLPNLTGPIIVYATLTVPQAILQESFLSFLGIGVRPPLPSWGNLAADGLPELNPYESRWWLLFFPCLLLGATLLALNFVGEGLRGAMDPKRRAR